MENITHEKLKRLSQRMANICLALACVMPIVMVIAISKGLADTSFAFEMFNNVTFDPAKLTSTIIGGVFAVQLIAALLISGALVKLRKAFKCFTGFEVKFAAAAKAIRSSGQWFVVAAIFGVFARTLSGLLLTFSNIPGQRQLSVGIGSTEFFGLLIAGTFLALGYVMALASQIDAENRGFI
jgi:hypothetical protein